MKFGDVVAMNESANQHYSITKKGTTWFYLGEGTYENDQSVIGSFGTTGLWHSYPAENHLHDFDLVKNDIMELYSQAKNSPSQTVANFKSHALPQFITFPVRNNCFDMLLEIDVFNNSAAVQFLQQEKSE